MPLAPASLAAPLDHGEVLLEEGGVQWLLLACLPLPVQLLAPLDVHGALAPGLGTPLIVAGLSIQLVVCPAG